MTEREAFEGWVKESGAFTDWSRCGEGYAKPLVDRTWRAWRAAIEWDRSARAREEKNEREMAEGTRCDGSCKDGLPCHC